MGRSADGSIKGLVFVQFQITFKDSIEVEEWESNTIISNIY